jgi:hypothetical protein
MARITKSTSFRKHSLAFTCNLRTPNRALGYCCSESRTVITTKSIAGILSSTQSVSRHGRLQIVKRLHPGSSGRIIFAKCDHH